jgi:hypothetical protein
MTMMFSNLARSDGDPKVMSSGHSSLGASDRMARGLGWFSIALGLAELTMPRQITSALGMEGKEGLVQAYGLREIGAGILTLSTEKQVGLWSRLAGDGLDLATLVPHLRADNPKRENVAVALAAVVGITLLDAATAEVSSIRHRRPATPPRLYGERSGLPKGIAASRGIARRDRGGTAPGATTLPPAARMPGRIADPVS